ncbi:hypothetical protein Gogos_009213 [Gossypium gossypioides]|uniref:DUF7745 domain-containing protein n=1 Tax=Gossypium gossypioides TaxID=34282 RepID=A0A7J9CE15_GOSGO|nr:hypothetical protein [Gossypium gossypioides]
MQPCEYGPRKDNKRKVTTCQRKLKKIRDQWDDKIKQLFYREYGDLPYLLDIKVDKHLFQAFAQYWNPAYSCFTFGKVDLVLTIEEYTTLLRCPRNQVNKAYSRAANVPTFLKRLMNITRMSEQWVATLIKRKGNSKCIHWKSLQDLILVHPDARKRVDVFPLSIYGLVIFPKALGHVDDAFLFYPCCYYYYDSNHDMIIAIIAIN